MKFAITFSEIEFSKTQFLRIERLGKSQGFFSDCSSNIGETETVWTTTNL